MQNKSSTKVTEKIFLLQMVLFTTSLQKTNKIKYYQKKWMESALRIQRHFKHILRSSFIIPCVCVLLSVFSVFYTAALFQACRICLHGVPSTEAATKKKTRMRPFANDWE